jgi:hypothetical protein
MGSFDVEPSARAGSSGGGRSCLNDTACLGGGVLVVVIFRPHEDDCEVGGPSYDGYCPGCARVRSRKVAHDA